MRRVDMPWLSVAMILLGMLSVMMPREAGRTNACFWDRDTLAMEAENYPGITEIITGRFDRRPPLYYEMRLARVEAALGSDPDLLELYDDAAVACDRLGRHDEAIAWMTRKRAAMDRLAAAGEELGDHEYRYLANLGTMHIHRWLAGGADRGDMSDVERSRALIAGAIEINADAHFGRERYQLLAIEWIAAGCSQQEREWHEPTLLEQIPKYNNPRHRGYRDRLAQLGYADAVEGLTGLIVLGNAWESVDVYYALMVALHSEEHSVLVLLCQMRIEELIADGRRSLAPGFDHERYENHGRPGDRPYYADVPAGYAEQVGYSYYPAAREEAEARAQRREAYMLERLERGEHPDTHPDFWSAWQETTSPPAMPSWIYNSMSVVTVVASLLILTVVALLLVVVLRLIWRSLRRVALM